MSYIGNTPTNQNFVAGADQFNGNGSTTAFTLSRNVNTVFDIFVAISNVPQDPYSAYSVSGNTLTFTSAPPSGTGNIYVVYRATNVQTFVPTQGVSPSFGNLTYTGTLTGSTGVMNIGSGQLYKDASGNVGIGTSSPAASLSVTKQTTALSGTGNSYGAYLYPTSSGQCWLDAVTSSSSNTSMGIRSYNNGTYYSANLDNSGNFQFNSGYGSTATAYGCRAWVNFNGTGTVAIRASGNVTSITDNALADFTVNFNTALVDANYAVAGTVRSTQSLSAGQVAVVQIAQSTAPTTSAVRIQTSSLGDNNIRANIDSDYVCISVFR